MSAEQDSVCRRMDLRALQRLEIRELCYFVAVAEELHFARAAERVGINQSPLSKAISLLEHRLRVRLFHRTRRRTLLTDVGAALLPHARTVLCDADRVRRDVAAFAAGRKGRLRIGIANGLSVVRIGKLLEDSQRQDPQVEFSLEYRSMSEQVRALRADVLDIGLAVSPLGGTLRVDLEIESLVLRTDPIMVAMRPDHLLAEQGTVRSLAAALGPYLIVGEPEMDAAELGCLLEENTKSEEAIEIVASTDLLLTAVLAGRGVGLLGEDQARHGAREGIEIRPLGLGRARMTTQLLRRREDSSAVLERFVERARRIV